MSRRINVKLFKNYQVHKRVAIFTFTLNIIIVRLIVIKSYKIFTFTLNIIIVRLIVIKSILQIKTLMYFCQFTSIKRTNWFTLL